MFGRQRRPKSLSFALPILLPHQLHHPSAKSRRLGSRALSSRIAMLQPFGPFLPISLPQPLRLPVTHPHQARRIHHLQLFALHSRQHFYPSQFPLAHPDSPHPASFRGRSLGDISNEEKRGHYHRGSTATSSPFASCVESAAGRPRSQGALGGTGLVCIPPPWDFEPLRNTILPCRIHAILS